MATTRGFADGVFLLRVAKRRSPSWFKGNLSLLEITYAKGTWGCVCVCVLVCLCLPSLSRQNLCPTMRAGHGTASDEAVCLQIGRSIRGKPSF